MAEIAGEEQFERNWLWLGADRDGQLAIFQTFGIGILPPSLQKSLNDADAVDAFALDHVLIKKDSCVGRVREHVRTELNADQAQREFAKLVAGFEEAASCGVFVYYPHRRPGDLSGGYIQVSYPTVPRTLATLPKEIRKIVEGTWLQSVSFHSPSGAYLAPEQIEDLKEIGHLTWLCCR